MGESVPISYQRMNVHQNDKTLGWALWHLVFNVLTVVRNKVTKTVLVRTQVKAMRKYQLYERAPIASSDTQSSEPTAEEEEESVT